MYAPSVSCYEIQRKELMNSAVVVVIVTAEVLSKEFRTLSRRPGGR